MYAVIWYNLALDQLADVLVGLDLNDQDTFATAVEELNRRLADDPLDVGESRSGTTRVTFVPFASIQFRVREAEQLVRVTRVVRYGW